MTLINIASRDERAGPPGGLITEADEVIKLTKDDLSRFIRRRRTPDDAASDTYDPVDSVGVAATEFAESWLYRASDDEFDALLDQRPRIPESLDGDLLYAVENVIGGSLRGQDRLRRAVRQALLGTGSTRKSRTGPTRAASPTCPPAETWPGTPPARRATGCRSPS